jgi:hypothetical protein
LGVNLIADVVDDGALENPDEEAGDISNNTA